MKNHRGYLLRRVVGAVSLAVLATVIVGGAGGAATQTGGTVGPHHRTASPASDTQGNHCVHPSGRDLNEFYGVSQQLVHAVCTQVDTGEHWTVVAIWFTGESFDAVPDGFVPAGSTPMEDFLAKFVGVRYVIDLGTSQEQTLYFPADGRTFTAVSPINGLPIASSVPFTIASPLSLGDHAVQVTWVMSDLHCDGLGDDPASNCMPGGETVMGTWAFEVVPAATALRVQRPAYALLSTRLTAVLANARSGTPTTGQTVGFRTGGVALCTGVTSTDGSATCTTGLIGTLAILLNGGYTAAFAGTADYQPSTGRAPA